MSDSVTQTLEKVFGFHSFRGEQESIVRHVIAGNDALVLMPTGGGKSLCYQLPALCRPGIGIVVSPLIALMQDQVMSLLQLGVRAAVLNSTLTSSEQYDVKRRVLRSEIDLLYVAPERLVTQEFLSFLKQLPTIALFAIDEAHCVSHWGHDFRPEYTQLAVLHQEFPNVPRIALTATADAPTRRDLIEQLELQQAKIFSAGFDRPNIRYRVLVKDNPKKQLLSFIRTEHQDEAGIVYCLTRKKVEDVAAWLQGQGFRALPYHAGLDAGTREANQRIFLKDEGVLIVATVAFGMGIDKSNVRFVAHLDLPKNLEAYYQETGRAGRDGLPANAWMAYGLSDVLTLKQILSSSDANEEHKRLEQQKLGAMLGFCETIACRRQALLNYFGESYQGPCNNCDTCLQPVQSWDGTVAAQQVLSCIYRTGQRFGAAYIIDVLRGEPNERIDRFGHQRLTTYGIGKDIQRAEWHSVIRQLVAGGLLAIDWEGYGGLKLTPESTSVLKGEQPLFLRKDPTITKTTNDKKEKRKKTKIQAASFVEESSKSLWEALRAERLRIAKEQNIAPYMIFHDSTLREMVEVRPQSLSDFRQITGVGDVKLATYGDAFLSVILTH